jgi:hypothetical protein
MIPDAGKMAVFRFLAPCSLVITAITLMMKAVGIYETSVNFYQTTRSYNPEESHLQIRRRENLVSHMPDTVYNRIIV